MPINSTPDFLIRQVDPNEVPTVAKLHFTFFGAGKTYGHSLARIGPNFLEMLFYRINLSNPYFFVTVATYENDIIAFCVYLTDRHKAFRHTIRKHLPIICLSVIQYLWHNPKNIFHLVSNLRYLGGEKKNWLKEVNGHLLLLAVKPNYRTKIFKQKTGIWVAWELCKSMEQSMKQHGCESWYTALAIDNQPINLFAQKFGAQLMGKANAQGKHLNYWCKNLL